MSQFPKRIKETMITVNLELNLPMYVSWTSHTLQNIEYMNIDNNLIEKN